MSSNKVISNSSLIFWFRSCDLERLRSSGRKKKRDGFYVYSQKSEWVFVFNLYSLTASLTLKGIT